MTLPPADSSAQILAGVLSTYATSFIDLATLYEQWPQTHDELISMAARLQILSRDLMTGRAS